MLQDTMQQIFFQNSVARYLIALSIFVLAILAVKLFQNLFLSRLKIWLGNTVSKLDISILHSLEKPLLPVLYFGAFHLAIYSLNVNDTISRFIDLIGIVIITISGIRFLVALLGYVLEFIIKTKGYTEREHSLKAILPILRVIVWGIGFIFLLDNLGFQISAVVAGLGIGGIAVALAAQAVLGDLFSYVSIIFDRPFELGDFIIIDEHLGTIEHIGIKTTRIRSLSGELLVFSNADLTGSRIRNYKHMVTRRVVFQFRIDYRTSSQALKEIPEIVKNIIESIEDTKFDRAHFASFGEFSLNFEVVYYVLGNDYNKYMNIQQTINLSLKEALEQRNIQFAYPTQRLYLQDNCRDSEKTWPG